MRFTILELPARWGASQEALADVDSALSARSSDRRDERDANRSDPRDEPDPRDERDANRSDPRDEPDPRDAPTRGESELVLLPEASLCGYVSPDGDADLAPFAEPLDGPTARACGELAAKHGVHLVAPLVLREGRALYNAMVAYDPRGQVRFVYRKRHPWIPETWATPGGEPPPVIEIDGVTITIAVCYDVHFLPHDAARELEAADVLLFPSAWVEEPDYRVVRLQRLAQRFDLTIVNANWGPGDVRVPGQGGSCVVDRAGRVVATVRDGRVDVEVPSSSSSRTSP